MFFTLCRRLPAYSGVLAARLAAEDRDGKRRRRSRADGGGTYERGSRYANRASTADSAPAATPGQLAALNMQLGGTFFSHRTVPAGGGAGG